MKSVRSKFVSVVPERKIIVNIAASADGYVARPDGNLDAKILGRKTFDRSLQLGARFSGDIIGSFLDENAIDEFIITVVPTFIGEGIPLVAPRQREVALRSIGVQQFSDGVVQLHYAVQRPDRSSNSAARQR